MPGVDPGSKTSHSVIVARSMKMPCVVPVRAAELGETGEAPWRGL